jgi:uncharacterized protein YjdB
VEDTPISIKIDQGNLKIIERMNDTMKRKSNILTAFAVLTLFAVTFVVAFSGIADEEGTSEAVPATGIIITDAPASLEEGKTVDLNFRLLPHLIADSEKVVWSTSNPRVATVNSSTGLVTGVKAGVVTITVKTQNTLKTDTCTILIKRVPVSYVEITTLFAGSIAPSETYKLNIIVHPDNASNKNVTWSSNDPDIADVDSNGLVTAYNDGTARITVTTEDGSKTDWRDITVKSIPVTGIKLNTYTWTSTPDRSLRILVEVLPSNATNKSITCSSSDTSVATVISFGTYVDVKTIKPGVATVTVKTIDKGLEASCVFTINAVPVTGVEYDSYTPVEIAPGGTYTLTATVLPTNATNKNVTWSSDNAAVATVNSDGVVTGVANGTAHIEVKTVDGGKTASRTVVVKTVAVTGVELDQTALTLGATDIYKLKETVLPSNAANKNVTWTTDNAAVAIVSSNGTVTAKAQGTAKITVITADGDKTATCTVTVSTGSIPVASVTLDKTSLDLGVGDRYTLTATVNPNSASDKTVTWSSSNSTVAKVSASGVVEALKVGTATITVKTNNGNKTATCLVTVTAGVPVTGVELDKTALSLEAGKSGKLVATVSPGSATNKEVSWASSDESIATVDGEGNVKAKAAGTATITVTTNNSDKAATCALTVTEAEGGDSTILIVAAVVAIIAVAGAGAFFYMRSKPKP